MAIAPGINFFQLNMAYNFEVECYASSGLAMNRLQMSIQGYHIIQNFMPDVTALIIYQNQLKRIILL